MVGADTPETSSSAPWYITFLPLINCALTFLGDQAIPAGAGQYEVVYGRNEPPVPEVPVGRPGVLQVPLVPQVPVGEPAVLQVPDPVVPQVPLKIKRENKKDTTTTKTARTRGHSKFRISIKRRVKSDPCGVILQTEPDTFQTPKMFAWNEPTQDSRVQNTSTLAPQANNQTDNQGGSSKMPDVQVSEAHETQPRVLLGTLPASSTRVSVVDKPNPFQSSKTDAYSEIEARMQMHMGRPYIAKQKDYIAIKEFLVSDIPLDWILSGIDRVFASRPDTRDRIRGFAYVAEVLKDDWACELAKQAPVQPIHFEHRTPNTQPPNFGSGTMSTKRPTTDPYTARPVRDERYEAFYRLFPND